MVKTVPFGKNGSTKQKNLRYISSVYVNSVTRNMPKPSAESRFRKGNPLRRFTLVTSSEEYRQRVEPGKHRVIFQIAPGKAFEVCYGNTPFQFAAYHPGHDPFSVFANQSIAAAQLKLTEPQVRDILEAGDAVDEIIRQHIHEGKDANKMCPLLDEEGNETDLALCAMFYVDRDPPTEIHIRRVGKNIKGEDIYGSMRECIALLPKEWKSARDMLETAMAEVAALQPMHFAPKVPATSTTTTKAIPMDQGEGGEEEEERISKNSPAKVVTNKKQKTKT